MGLQPENAVRFSMCNCITLGFPNTYTAHGLSVDMFLNIAVPDTRYPVQFIDHWPGGYVKCYKFPKTINTFIFSTFNEVCHESYLFPDGNRYVLGPNEGLVHIKNNTKKIDRLDPIEYCRKIKLMEKKVDIIWPNCKKILLLYDTKRASQEIKDRFILYNNYVCNTINCPVVRIKDSGCPKPFWGHYLDSDRKKLFEDIENVESKSDIL